MGLPATLALLGGATALLPVRLPRLRLDDGVGRFLVLCGPGRRFVVCRITGVHALGHALRIGSFKADRRGPFEHEVGEAQVDRGFGREIFPEAQDARSFTLSVYSLQRLIPVFATLAR